MLRYCKMQFTYNAYALLIKELYANGYEFVGYDEHDRHSKTVIMRHDVDMSVEKALEIARIEHELNVRSTYFVLISSDFYNTFSKKNEAYLNEINKLGHEIGLHFDEVKYRASQCLVADMEKEIELLERYLDRRVTTISMHRPSKNTLDADYIIKSGQVINSYGKKYFKDFKYVSDSRRNWQEDIFKIIKSDNYDKLHILTHPIWYGETEKNMKETLMQFVKNASLERYQTLNDNLKDLALVISEFDVL